MPNGYWIARIAVTNPERYGAYAQALPAVIERFGGRFLVAGGQIEAVEGDAKPRNVLIAFDDFETARACWHSAEYADARSTDGLVLVLFDLLFLNGEDLTGEPLRVRKERLQALLSKAPPGLQYSEHHLVSGESFYRHACKLGIEGIVSKRLDCPYKPGDRGVWRKVKCLNREEFVVVGWTDPEGSRPHLGALLLAYYAPDGRLVYAGRAGTGMNAEQLRRLRKALERLATTEMPLDVRPPKGTRFGSPLVLSRVHWVRPEMVVEVTYLTWTDDNLLRHVVFNGVREDKPARDVVRPIPYPEKVPASTEQKPAPLSRRMARPQ